MTSGKGLGTKKERRCQIEGEFWSGVRKESKAEKVQERERSRRGSTGVGEGGGEGAGKRAGDERARVARAWLLC